MLVKNIKFRRYADEFQAKMKSDIKDIADSKKIWVKADKTSNFYKMEVNDYNKRLTENISKEYKKERVSIERDINVEAKGLVSKIGIEDRVCKYKQKEAFLTAKDHKPNFIQNPTFRLINPASTELGRISKQILEKASRRIREVLKVNQWISTNNVLDWFKGLEEKSERYFLKLDIVSFYPSITEELLKKAVLFAEKLVEFTSLEKDIIFHSRKTLVFKSETPWVKRKGNPLFDVAMGAADGAEVAEMVGLFLLNEMQNVIKKEEGGMYRDDYLSALKGSKVEIERKRKQLIQIFAGHNLKLDVAAPIAKRTDFLDVVLDLETGTFEPYSKDSNVVEYVSKYSNHPPMIIRQIPKIIEDRISGLSSNEEIFNRTKGQYEEALLRAGYDVKLEYRPRNDTNPGRKKRKGRNIIWFNPPFCKSVQTNIGRTFLNLVKTNFPKGHNLHKIINKNNVKMSYSCTKNMQRIITSNNSKVINENLGRSQQEERKCNCCRGRICPLNGRCLEKGLVYRGKVTPLGEEPKNYIGMTARTFKLRWKEHKYSWNHRNSNGPTELTRHIWDLNDRNKEWDIE